jgi:dihydrofolate synthase/folylpolyglutamate synthase
MPHVTASYSAALRRLFAFERTGMRLGLETPRALHAALDHPERAFTTLQVAGTNGKGTTAACVHAILRAAGVRTGLYTSPHLIDFSERVRLDGRAIAPDDVERLLATLMPCAEELGASYFEIVTGLAAMAFAEARVDVAVAEVGLGGRLDATTVWPASLGAITSIDLDHMHVLGGTIEAIAREKAGIAREGMTVLVAEPRPDLQRVIEDEARARGGRCVIVGRDAQVHVRSTTAAGSTIDVHAGDGRVLAEIHTPLLGAHQARNAGLAVLLALYGGAPRIDDDSIRAGLARVRWPARAERLDVRGTRVLVDVAHNPAAAERLAETLRTIMPDERPLGVIGMLEDKDASGVARALAPVLRGAIITQPEWKRARPADALASAWRDAGGHVSGVEHELREAIDRGLVEAAAHRALLLVTGSCYTVGHALPYLGVHSLDTI